MTYQGPKVLSAMARNIGLRLDLLERSEEFRKREKYTMHKGKCVKTLDLYEKECRTLLENIDSLRTLLIEKHPDALTNILD